MQELRPLIADEDQVKPVSMFYEEKASLGMRKNEKAVLLSGVASKVS